MENIEFVGAARATCCFAPPKPASSTRRAFAIAASETKTSVPGPVLNPPWFGVPFVPPVPVVVTKPPVTAKDPPGFTALSSKNRVARGGLDAVSSKNRVARIRAFSEIATARPFPVVNPLNAFVNPVFGVNGVVLAGAFPYPLPGVPATG